MKFENFKKTVGEVAGWRVIAILKDEQKKAKSAWNNGVYDYAIELLETIENTGNLPTDLNALEKLLLNGADSWEQYSYGGCSLIYNCDIAERLCNASELKIVRNGEREPDSRDSWLDVQTRALTQALKRIARIKNDCIKYDYIDAISSKFLENKEHMQGIRQYGVINLIVHSMLENMILFKNNKTLEFWKYETCGSGRYTHYRDVNSVQCYTDKFEVIENGAKFKKDQKYILKIDMRRSFFKKLEKELKAFINED